MRFGLEYVTLTQQELPAGAECIAGTSLWILGKAPRASRTDRHAQGWYWCERCGGIVMVRCQSVRPEHTVSCGCAGRRSFIDHYEKEAAAVPSVIRKEAFIACYRRKNPDLNPRLRVRIKHSWDRYLVDFVIHAHQRFLLAAAKLGSAALRCLSAVEWRWLNYCEDHPWLPRWRQKSDHSTLTRREEWEAWQRTRASWKDQTRRWESMEAAGIDPHEWFLEMTLDPDAVFSFADA
jgi:hypothetical protein